MAAMATWEQRMAGRAALRAEALALQRQRAEAADRARLAADPPQAGEDPGLAAGDGPGPEPCPVCTARGMPPDGGMP